MSLFKNILLLFFSVFGCFLTFGQIKLNNKIIDSESNLPLANSLIINIKTNDTLYSNNNGYFGKIASGTFLIKKIGYKEKIIALIGDVNHIIQLEIKHSQLNEVVIRSNNLQKKLKKTPAAIAIISSKDIKRANTINFAPIINTVPGVFMQSGALNTNRITIRGIGSRNLFGTAKIRAYFKDIPLTNGSGETTIEDFELASISRFEIIKGASSSIYGAGLGGVINIIPKSAYFNQNSISNELLVGSFNLTKSIITLNHGTTKNNFSITHSNTHSDGYRDNNKYYRQTLTLNSNYFINKKDELSLLMSYVNLKAFIPSSINEDTFLNSPKSAAFTWAQSQGFEDSKRGVLGLSWNHQYSTNLKQITSVFSSFRNTYEPRPFNILKENVFAFGLRSRLLGNLKILKKIVNYTFGGEIFKDIYNYKTFENLYEDFPIETGSIRGERLSNFKEKRNYYNIFFETDYQILKKTELSIGLNLNKTGYYLNDMFTISTSNPDQSGSFKFKNILSPKFGLWHELSKNINIFSSISHGFSPITLNETLLPNGQINTNLKPETGWNFEIGLRGSLLKNTLQFSSNIYRLDIKNLLVSRRINQNEFIGINAGHTQHDGIELSINYQFIEKENLSISLFSNYTINNFIFKDFIDNENNFSGNDLTGVPSNVFNLGIDIKSTLGIYGNINFKHVGRIPITDSNSLYSNTYSLTNFKIGYKKNLSKKLNLNTYFGLNNAFNKAYASQILINASSFGGNPPRYYYPGNPINFYTGINLNYIF